MSDEEQKDWGLSAALKKGRHLKDFITRTTDAVMEKTEEASQAMKLRMAILDIEHHLNRLYPDIGKQVCDLWSNKEVALTKNKDLQSKVELVHEYRQRLAELRQQMSPPAVKPKE